MVDLDEVSQEDIDFLMRKILKAPYKPYRQHSKFAQMLMANGCGGKSSLINPPNFVFVKACNEHDCKYFYGGSKKRRKEADKAFYEDMKSAIKTSSKNRFRKMWLKVIAWIYYIEVRRHGAGFFNFRNGEKF